MAAQVDDLGGGSARGLAAALSIAQMRASVEKTDSERRAIDVDTGQKEALFPARSLYETARAAIEDRNHQQLVTLFPTVLDKARAEVQSLRASTLLNELASKGAINEARFQEFVGQAGPWGKVLANMVKLGAVGAGAAAVLKKPSVVFKRR